jgi:hypothetical protein
MRTLALFGCALAAGCNDPTYIPGAKTLATMADAMGMIASDSDTFIVPIRRPNAAEQTARQDEQQAKMLPMAVPWVGVRSLPVQVQYTIKNVDSVPAKAFFTASGGSEFGIYNPADFVDPNDPEAIAPPPLLGGTPIDLAPGESRTLTFREDDVAEAAVDVEAIVRYPGPGDQTIPFQVLTRRSDVDPIGTQMIPKDNVTPQMIIFTFTLAADAKVTAEYDVRVRNIDNRLSPAGMGPLYR